jgi:hypothetical protein
VLLLHSVESPQHAKIRYLLIIAFPARRARVYLPANMLLTKIRYPLGKAAS